MQMLLSQALQRYLISHPDKVSLVDFPNPTPNYLKTRKSANIQILKLFDDDKRNTTESAFSIQNVVEIGLNDHDRLPGEWYGVSKISEIFASLNETYNFDSNLSGNFLGNFKICEFKNGEIITKEVLAKALGKEKYEEILTSSPSSLEYSSLEHN
jgi:hypothetical protein